MIECELKEVDVQEIDLKSVATVCDYQDEELTLLEVIFRTTEVSLSLSLSLTVPRYDTPRLYHARSSEEPFCYILPRAPKI